MKLLMSLALATCLVAPGLAVAGDPPAEAADFPTKITPAGQQFLDRCSDKQILDAPDVLLQSARCQALYSQWFSQAGETLPRSNRSTVLRSNIPFHTTVMMPVSRKL